jgi:uncharacterized membrane protein
MGTAFNPANAFHPIIVHFPIALFFASLALDALAMVRRDPALHIAAFYDLAFAVIGALASLLTGYIAMMRLKFPFEGDMRSHVFLTASTTVFLILLYAIRVHRHAKMGTVARVIYLIVGLVGAIVLASAGHFGGKLVYGS